jgi:hypothetical protein
METYMCTILRACARTLSCLALAASKSTASLSHAHCRTCIACCFTADELMLFASFLDAEGPRLFMWSGVTFKLASSLLTWPLRCSFLGEVPHAHRSGIVSISSSVCSSRVAFASLDGSVSVWSVSDLVQVPMVGNLSFFTV